VLSAGGWAFPQLEHGDGTLGWVVLESGLGARRGDRARRRYRSSAVDLRRRRALAATKARAPAARARRRRDIRSTRWRVRRALRTVFAPTAARREGRARTARVTCSGLTLGSLNTITSPRTARGLTFLTAAPAVPADAAATASEVITAHATFPVRPSRRCRGSRLLISAPWVVPPCGERSRRGEPARQETLERWDRRRRGALAHDDVVCVTRTGGNRRMTRRARAGRGVFRQTYEQRAAGRMRSQGVQRRAAPGSRVTPGTDSLPVGAPRQPCGAATEQSPKRRACYTQRAAGSGPRRVVTRSR